MNVATLYATIRPQTTGFSTQAKSELNPVVTELKNLLHIPVTADGTAALNVIGGIKASIGGLATMAGVGGGIYGGIRLGQQALDEYRNAETTLRRVDNLYKEGSPLVKQWAADSVHSMGLMNDEAMDLAANLAQYFQGTGLEGEKLAQVTTESAKRIIDVASFTGHTNEEVQTALESAIRGRILSLKEFTGMIDEAEVTDKARAMGLTARAVDEKKVASARQHLADVTNQLSRAQTGQTATSSELAIAQDRMTQAQNRVILAQDRLRRAQPGSAEALSAQNELIGARDAVIQTSEAYEKLKSKGPDLAEIAKLTQAQTEAQDALNEALGGAEEPLTAENRALAVNALFIERTMLMSDSFGKTSADRAKTAAATWRTALEAIGRAIDPIVTGVEMQLAGWLETHQDDVARFAQSMVDLMRDVKDFIGFLVDHKEILMLLGGLLLLGKAGGVYRDISGLPGLGGLVGLGGIGGGRAATQTVETVTAAATTASTRAATTTAAQVAAGAATKSAVGAAEAAAAAAVPTVSAYAQNVLPFSPGGPALTTAMRAEQIALPMAIPSAAAAPVVTTAETVGLSAAIASGVKAGILPLVAAIVAGKVTGSTDIGLGTGVVVSLLGRNFLTAGLFAAPLIGEEIAKSLFGAPGFDEAGKKLRGQMTVEGTPASEDMYRAQELAAKGQGRKAGELFFADWQRLLATSSQDELDKILAFVKGQSDHRTTQLKIMEEDYIKKVTGKAPMEYAPEGTALAPYGKQGLIEAQAMMAAKVDKGIISAWLQTYIDDLKEHPGLTSREDVEALQKWAEEAGLDVANYIGAAVTDFIDASVQVFNQQTLNMNQIFALQQQAAAWMAAIASDPTRGWSAPMRPPATGGPPIITKESGGFLTRTGYFYGHQGEYVETAAEVRMRTHRSADTPPGDTYNVNTWYPSADVDVVTSVRRAARLGRSRERRIAPPHQWAPTLRVK